MKVLLLNVSLVKEKQKRDATILEVFRQTFCSSPVSFKALRGSHSLAELQALLNVRSRNSKPKFQ